MNEKVTSHISSKLVSKYQSATKNGDPFLVLKIESNALIDDSFIFGSNVIFVFDSNVSEEQWDNLRVDDDYEFTIQKTNNHSSYWNLIDFKRV